jgi:hypothetical protein
VKGVLRLTRVGKGDECDIIVFFKHISADGVSVMLYRFVGCCLSLSAGLLGMRAMGFVFIVFCYRLYFFSI